MQIITTADTTASVMHVQQWLSRQAANPVVVLASGGSSAPILAAAWQQLSSQQQANITISLADERYGSPNHPDSNWALLQRCGIDLSDARHRPVLQPDMTMQQVTAGWNDWLAQTISSGVPVVSFLGIGPDAHIAGLKPHSPALHDTAMASCYEWSDYMRITTTPACLLRLASTAVYAQGAAKQPVIDALQINQDVDAYPGQLLKQLADCTVYYQQ